MRFFDVLTGGSRERTPDGGRDVTMPALSYQVYAGDPDPVPGEIILTRTDGSKVVYLPKVEGPPLPQTSWRHVNDAWSEGR